MDARLAQLYIKKVSYKPTWTITTELTSDGRELMLYVDYVERNSNSEYAPSYQQKAHNTLIFPFTTAELTTGDQVYRKVLNCLLECEKHEATEFFKVGPTYRSPFHPHTDAGLDLLATTDDVERPVAS